MKIAFKWAVQSSGRAARWALRGIGVLFALGAVLTATARVDRSMCLRILGFEAPIVSTTTPNQTNQTYQSQYLYHAFIADVDRGRITIETRLPPRREFAYLPALRRAIYTTDDEQLPPFYTLILQNQSGIFSEDYILQPRMLDGFDSEERTDEYRRMLATVNGNWIAYLWREPGPRTDAIPAAEYLSISDARTGQTRSVKLPALNLFSSLYAISEDGAYLALRRVDAQSTLNLWSLGALGPLSGAPVFITGDWVPGQAAFAGIALESGRPIYGRWSPVDGWLDKKLVAFTDMPSIAWKTFIAPTGKSIAFQYESPMCAGSYCPNLHYTYDLFTIQGTVIAQDIQGDVIGQITASASGGSPPGISPTPYRPFRTTAHWSADGQTFYYLAADDENSTARNAVARLIALDVSTGETRIIAEHVQSQTTDSIFFPTYPVRYYSPDAMIGAATNQRVVVPVLESGETTAIDLMNADGSARVRLLTGVDTLDTVRNPFHYYFEGIGWAADGITVLLPWTINGTLNKPTRAGVTWADVAGTTRFEIGDFQDVDLVNLAIDQNTRRASAYFGLVGTEDRTGVDFVFELVNVQTARRYRITLPTGFRPRDWTTWFAPGGKYAAVAFDSNTRAQNTQALHLINLEDGTVEPIAEGYIAAWSPDGARVAMGRIDLTSGLNYVEVLTPATGRRQFLVPDRLAEIRTMSWNPCR